METRICIGLIMNNTNSTKKYREFGLVVGFIFPLLVGYLIPLITGHSFRIWSLFFGVPLILLSITEPRKLRYLYRLWIWVGEVLGFVNSRIILGSIFFFILFPIAFLMRIIGHDPLRRKKNNKKSYRELRKDVNINLENIF